MSQAAFAETASPPGRQSSLHGWTLLEFDRVRSTNLVAVPLGAWHAVRADTQSAGRGRFQRSWVSDAGGLWLSAVVPAGDSSRRQLLPLAAGLAVVEALEAFGVKGARLRWPNDIMVDDRKLAGLLVDCFRPDLAVIGIGVNVSNDPAGQDATLRGTATRLRDLVPICPAPAEVAASILVALRSVVGILLSDGLTELCPRINALWGERRRVRLDLDGLEATGWFEGVDEGGRLQLTEDGGALPRFFEPHEVRLLREI